jgi:hypothetical protein
MSLRAGPLTFGQVTYDAPSDVLYARLRAEPTGAREHTPEGDVLTFDAGGRLTGMIVMEPRERLERDGAVYVTLPGGGREPLQGIQALLRTGTEG